MRFKKVLLVNPFYGANKFSIPVVPAGLGYLSEYLIINGIDYDILDMSLGYDLEDLKKCIIESNPDLIGFSIASIRYRHVFDMIGNIKKGFSDKYIVVGGPHISSLREEILKLYPAVDFGIVLEGEKTLLELCMGKEQEDINGLMYRRDGQVVYNEEINSIDNLDLLPFPKYSNFELSRYGYGMSIVTSRGCPYQCIYCSAHAVRKKNRLRTADNVVDEMEYWYQRGYREFGLQEDNPTFNKNRMFEICDEIERRRLKDIIIMCGNGIRADCVDRELLARMKQVGFKRLAIGVEGGNDKILKNLKKGERMDVIKKAISEACKLDFFVSLFFVVGSPGETFHDFQDSVDIALSYPVSNVSFFNLIPFPATELFKWIQKNKYFIIDPEEYLNWNGEIQMAAKPLFQTPEFPAEQRIRALKKAKSVERYVKKRAIEKKFLKIFPVNKVIAYLYALPWIEKLENRFLRSEIFRNTLGKIRDKTRMFFYR